MFIVYESLVAHHSNEQLDEDCYLYVMNVYSLHYGANDYTLL